MNKRVVIELDRKLVEGEILIFKDGMLKSVEIHELLPDLLKASEDIQNQQNQLNELKQNLANLAKLVKEK